jgi:MFS family permease
MPHPVQFMFLIVPFGATSGFLGVCLAYLLTEAKVEAAAVAGLLALAYLPHTWKFLWAPLVDLTLTRKLWYFIGLAGVVLGIGFSGTLPMATQSMPQLTVIVLLTMFCATLVGMAVESVMAYSTSEDAKGRASGWFQAGNLGGGGLGGGLALWLIQSGGFTVEAASWAMAGTLALCAWPMAFLKEAPAEVQGLHWRGHVKRTALDLWGLLRSRTGALALLICFLPIGTGALSNLWSIIAHEWQASANTVALVTGTLSGLLSAAGCLLGGFLCDRMDRKKAYCLFGLVLGACTLGMAFGPRTEWSYVLFTSLYSVVVGFCYAAYSAVVLEAIGKGAAATKFNVLASLANTPIAWVTALSGWLLGKYGSTWALASEMALALVAVVGFVGVVVLSAGRRAPPDAAA